MCRFDMIELPFITRSVMSINMAQGPSLPSADVD